jgi:hypothetical protein
MALSDEAAYRNENLEMDDKDVNWIELAQNFIQW